MFLYVPLLPGLAGDVADPSVVPAGQSGNVAASEEMGCRLTYYPSNNFHLH